MSYKELFLEACIIQFPPVGNARELANVSWTWFQDEQKKLDGNSWSWDIELLMSKRTDNNGKHFKFYASLFISVIWIEGKQNTTRTSASTEKKIQLAEQRCKIITPKRITFNLCTTLRLNALISQRINSTGDWYFQIALNTATEITNFTTYQFSWGLILFYIKLLLS